MRLGCGCVREMTFQSLVRRSMTSVLGSMGQLETVIRCWRRKTLWGDWCFYFEGKCLSGAA